MAPVDPLEARLLEKYLQNREWFFHAAQEHLFLLLLEGKLRA